MSVATSAIESLQDVAVQAGAITTADERATAADLKIPIAAVHGAATFYDDLARTRRGSRHVRVCEGTACFAADGGQHVGDVERVLGVSAGSCREDGVEGSDLPGMHHRFAAALATAYEMITDTNRSAREAGRIDRDLGWRHLGSLRHPAQWANSVKGERSTDDERVPHRSRRR
jgi:Thioredoxin-like [2Fe-2S] ferredoxin